MGAYKKILVAVDLNDEAITLIEKAKLQLSTEGELHILHVGSILAALMPVSAMGSSTSDDVELFQKEYQEQALILLHQIAQKTSIEPDKLHFILGTKVHEIRQYAENNHFQLLVLGVHERKGLGHLLESVVHGTLGHAPCDILSVLI